MLAEGERKHLQKYEHLRDDEQRKEQTFAEGEKFPLHPEIRFFKKAQPAKAAFAALPGSEHPKAAPRRPRVVFPTYQFSLPDKTLPIENALLMSRILPER